MAGSSRSRLALLLALGGAVPLAAQQPARVTGRIIRPLATGHPVGAAGARVVLHRVSAERQGALDSLRTGTDGGFRFLTPRDTIGLYLVSARHAGIEFFSQPLRLPASGQPEAITLVVADSSSRQPVELGSRFLVIGAPNEERRRSIVDLFVIRNGGIAARVGADSLDPTFTAVLPAAQSHRVPEMGSEVSAVAVRFDGDTARVFAPIAPGEKQLLVEHIIPASQARLTVPLGSESVPVQVVLEEPGAAVTGAGVTRIESQTLDGRPMERWAGTPPGGAVLTITFPGPAPQEGRIVVGLAALVGIFLLAGTLLGFRRRHLAARETGR